MTKIQTAQIAWRSFPGHGHFSDMLFSSLGHSGFGFVSDFDILISDLTVLSLYQA
jgi:hypothetical protein